jgi:hypothetical protein
MSQLREYIEKNPSETQRLLGIDYDQLMRLIINAEHLHARQKNQQESEKVRIIKPGSGRPLTPAQNRSNKAKAQKRIFFLWFHRKTDILAAFPQR